MFMVSIWYACGRMGDWCVMFDQTNLSQPTRREVVKKGGERTYCVYAVSYCFSKSTICRTAETGPRLKGAHSCLASMEKV